MNGYRMLLVVPSFVLVTLSHSATHHVSAESAIDLISGFDSDRIDSTYPVDDVRSAGEMAKLIYRLRNIDSNVLASRVGDQPASKSGDAIHFDGLVDSIRTIEVPKELVDFLDLTQLQLLTISQQDSRIDVVTDKVHQRIRLGDRIAGVGVAIDIKDTIPAAIASTVVSWFPDQVPNVGWKLLRDAGVDASLLAELPSRDRRPLSAADSQVFYAMLSAATKMAARDDLDVPVAIEPLSMLQESADLSGQWIQTELETVQITKVFVTDPVRRAQLGKDHYFQIDAVGDLGNVVVKIEPTAKDAQPALFDGRYPVSIVTAELPSFLTAPLVVQSGRDAIVTQMHTKIGVQGFFFRQWSYESEFMNQHGGENQFGPLLIAVRVTDREPARGSFDRVGMIGTMAAIAVFVGVLTTFFWHRRTSAGDLAARRRRQAREAERVDFPSNST